MLGTFGRLSDLSGDIWKHAAWHVYLGLMWGIWAYLLNRLTNTTSVGVEWGAPLYLVARRIIVSENFPGKHGQ